MSRNLFRLDEYITVQGADGYLIEGGSDEPDQRYISGIDAPDPFITLYTGGETHVLIAGMEQRRAKAEGLATTVERNETYGVQGRIQIYGKKENIECLVSFLQDHHVSSVAVPYWFSTATADALRGAGITVQPDTDGIMLDVRAQKSSTEINHIQNVQRAAESAMEVAERLITDAAVVDGTLSHDGQPLTSDRVRTAIEIELLRHGCSHSDQEAIVACGEEAADPHNRGNGRLLADKPIIVDIFPRSKSNHYFGDISRTFLKGTTSEEIKSMYEVVHRAQQAALDCIEPGIKAKDVHDAACEVIEDAGFETTRTAPESNRGFVHRTGHGVGLALHENPRIGPKGGKIHQNQVVTIEPGLYDPATGGIRIEDLIVVTDDGYENLTAYPKELIVS